MYHPGRAEEFLAIELVGGYIHYLVNDGSGVRILVARTPRLVRVPFHLGLQFRLCPID